MKSPQKANGMKSPPYMRITDTVPNFFWYMFNTFVVWKAVNKIKIPTRKDNEKSLVLEHWKKKNSEEDENLQFNMLIRFVYAFIQQIIIDWPLHTRHCARDYRCNSGQKRWWSEFINIPSRKRRQTNIYTNKYVSSLKFISQNYRIFSLTKVIPSEIFFMKAYILSINKHSILAILSEFKRKYLPKRFYSQRKYESFEFACHPRATS